MRQTEVEQIFEQVLSYQNSDHLQLSLTGTELANTRFANNTITQNTVQKDNGLSVIASFGQKVGQASTNRLQADGLKEVVSRAEKIAQSAAEDSEYLPPVSTQTYAKVSAYDHQTAMTSPQARAEKVQLAIQQCEPKGLKLAGHYSTGWNFRSIANSNGLLAYHRQSYASYTNTVMSNTSSGWAETVGENLDLIHPLRAVEIASQKATASQSPKDITPGKYKVILEPSAVASILGPMFYSLDARSAHEGRSAFSDKEGTQIGQSAVDLYSQSNHPACPNAPFFFNGLPIEKTHWIKAGILENLAYNRFWANQTSHRHTGSPTNMIMDGDHNTLEQMITDVERGLLVTRFWYVRFVDPMTLLLTGMTRDGLFWIENGQIQYGVKNLRFNESPLNVLANIEMMGQPQRASGSTYIPPIMVNNFNFTSGTAF